MAKGKRGAAHDAPQQKRGRLARNAEPVDPVAQQCHAIAEALQSADLPLMIKETLVAVMPNALAVSKDDRHNYQEQIVQTIGNTLNDIEADIKRRLAEAETQLKEAEAKTEELMQEHVLAQEAASAQSELLLEKKKPLAQNARKLREVKRSLAEARDAEHAGCREGNKFVEDCESLTLAMTRFEPLKNGTFEPAQNIQEETAKLMNSLKGRLELNEGLSAALPAALATPILARSSFTTMVVHQFEELLMSQIKDLKKRCEAEESSREGFAATVLTAEQVVESAVAHQMEAAEAFMKEKDALGVKTQTVQEKAKARRNSYPLKRNCESSLAELQIELDSFQTGPLETFGKLQCRTKEAPENAMVAAPEGKGTAAPAQDAEAGAAMPAMPPANEAEAGA